MGHSNTHPKINVSLLQIEVPDFNIYLDSTRRAWVVPHGLLCRVAQTWPAYVTSNNSNIIKTYSFSTMTGRVQLWNPKRQHTYSQVVRKGIPDSRYRFRDAREHWRTDGQRNAIFLDPLYTIVPSGQEKLGSHKIDKWSLPNLARRGGGVTYSQYV